MIGIYVIRWILKVVEKILATNKRLDPTVSGFLVSILSFALKFFLFIIVVARLGFESTSFVAIAGAAVFALAFALQGSLGNLAAGALLLSMRYIKVGDLVTVAGETGFVRRIEMFTSQVVTPDGILITIPNSDVTGQNIANYSRLDSVRLSIAVGISYDDDVFLARQVALDVMRNNDMVLVKPPPSVVVVELGDNSVNLDVRPWVEARHYHRAMVQILEEVYIAYNEAGLSIPYPQRDLHLNLVDTVETPKSYPKWVELAKRPGGANRLFRRSGAKQRTELLNLLQLSDAERARMEEDRESDNDDEHAAHFTEKGGIAEGDEDDYDDEDGNGDEDDAKDDDGSGSGEDAGAPVLDVEDMMDEGESNARAALQDSRATSSTTAINRPTEL